MAHRTSFATGQVRVAYLVALAAGCFVLDATLPLGAGDGLPYLIVALLAAQANPRQPRPLWPVTCSGLVVVGMAVSPPGLAPWYAAANRVIAIAGIWIVWLLATRNRAPDPRPGVRPAPSNHLRLRSDINEADERLLHFVKYSPLAVIEWDPDLHIVRWMGRAQEIFGWSEEETLGKHWTDLKFVHPEDMPVAEKASADLLSGEDHNSVVQCRHLRKDGRLMYAEWFTSTSRDATGKVVSFLSHVQDVTTRVNSELALRESAARMGAILDNAIDAIITIDETGMIESFNVAAERMFGYTPAEVIGQNVTRLMPQPYADQHPGYLRRYRETGEKRIIGVGREVEALRKNGTTFPIDLAVSEIQLGDRRIFTGFIRDITERKKYERQIEEQSIQLRMSNLELKDMQNSLQEMVANLARSNEELDDFAHVASHDLKEPLRGINNYAAFLLEDYDDKLDDEGRKKLHTLIRLSRRMEALIDSLLQFSRLGRVELAVQRTSLNEVLDEVLDSLRVTLEESGVEVRVPAPLPTIVCDRIRVGEVFRNLITNAIKYAGKTEKWVEIGCVTDADLPPSTHRDTAAGKLVFYVRDNGIGIAAQHQESIFRIFRRLHGRDEFGGGSGAGLTIAQKIVRRHNGDIWVHSEPGKGSTFYFTLNGAEHEASDHNLLPAHTAG